MTAAERLIVANLNATRLARWGEELSRESVMACILIGFPFEEGQCPVVYSGDEIESSAMLASVLREIADNLETQHHEKEKSRPADQEKTCQFDPCKPCATCQEG